MLKKVLFGILLTLGCLGLFLSALLSWNNDGLAKRYKTDLLSENYKAMEALKPPLLLYEPLDVFLSMSAFQPDLDAYVILDWVEAYLERRPLDADVWVLGSRFYQRVGDREKAELYLSVAYRLSKNNLSILRKVFNRYLELGMLEEAMVAAGNIALAEPRQFRRLFHLMTRLSDDYQLIVKHMIPTVITEEFFLQRSIGIYEYFNWALSDSIRFKNKELAYAVWEAAPLILKRDTDLGVRFINYIASIQRAELMESAWFEVTGKESSNGYLLNDFNVNSASPCWNSVDVDGASVKRTVGENTTDIMHVIFSGSSNVHYNHLSCIVPIQSNSSYKLTGLTKGEGVSTLSGPFVDIIFPGSGVQRARSEVKVGNWGWASFELFFETPNDVSFAKIRIRRNRTKLLDSKISGSFLFRDFYLETQNSEIEVERVGYE